MEVNSRVEDVPAQTVLVEPTSMDAASADTVKPKIPKYAYYALLILTIANLLNYLDRSILSILAEEVKHDLELDDAQLGFLLGTAFAVFYAVVGIAMGRISDLIRRQSLMASGLTIWSVMTSLGGLAINFTTLGLARVGVGIGEATANPCSHSLLSDYFPPRRRSIALSIYLTGTFVGAALAMIVGGWFLDQWPQLCQSISWFDACAVASWKAALIAVGLPGIPLALLVWTLREPPSQRTISNAPAVSVILREFAAAIPPFTLLTIWRLGGKKALTHNLKYVIGIALGAVVLTQLVGDAAQWAAIGLGAYAICTWGQVQSFNDKPLYVLTFGCKTFVMATVGAAMLSCIGGAIQLWVAPYVMRNFELTSTEVGMSIGVISIGGAVIGVLLGGMWADRWKQADKRAPVWLGIIAAVTGVPAVVAMLLTDDVTVFLIVFFIYSVLHSLSPGAFAALAQDLVLPRMRGAGASAFSLMAIVVGIGAGPYWAGKVSVMSGSLVTGLLSMQILVPIAVFLFWLASKRLLNESPERRRALAEAAGEPTEAEALQMTNTRGAGRS